MNKLHSAYVVGVRSLAALMAALPLATSAASPPDLTGVWSPAGSVNASGADAAARRLPLRPEAKARHEAFNAIVAPTGDTPGGVCLGAGMPGVLLGGGGYPMEIIQRPEQITVIFELHGVVRHFYFGARNAAEADRLPARIGYSSGRWEGNVLVVDTNNLVEQLDQRATPHSDAATIVERYRVEGPDAQGRRILIADVTVNDPKFYTEPLKLTRQWTEVPNGRLLPYDCNEDIWFDRVEELARKAGVKVP
jgi:hypothetical protein